MKIKKLHIQNYKSLANLEIIEPNPFTVFAGSNGAGKSNIFEALEFFTTLNEQNDPQKVFSLFGGVRDLYNYNTLPNFNSLEFEVSLDDDNVPHSVEIRFENLQGVLTFSGATFQLFGNKTLRDFISDEEININIRNTWIKALTNPSFEQFFNKFSRLFIGSTAKSRQFYRDDIRLNADASNLEKVLKRLFSDDLKKEEILTWLDLLVPGFSSVEIVREPLSGTDSLIIYEKGTNKPFTRNLLSDGTWNILALLTAVYQSDGPQFLCIEEPENGLNPKVQKELVNLFRQKCEDEGHYIWLNTHSQTIVNQLTPKELILVDKVDGETKIKQLTDSDTSGLSMDEAWLTNTLGGGIPW